MVMAKLQENVLQKENDAMGKYLWIYKVICMYQEIIKLNFELDGTKWFEIRKPENLKISQAVVTEDSNRNFSWKL